MFYIYFMYVCMYVHTYIFQEQPNNRTYSLGISNQNLCDGVTFSNIISVKATNNLD